MKMIRLAAALLIALAATTAHAQQNTFDIKTGGTTTGNCHYTFESSKGGFKISSHYLNHVPPEFQEADPVTGKAPTTTTETQGVNTYKLDANYNFEGGNVLNPTNQLNNGFSPNKQRTEMQVSRMQAGIFQGDPLVIPLKPGLVVLPNLDASAVQTFLYLATTHPAADSNYFLVLPTPFGIPQTVTVHWTAQSDATGTLDGKAVALHHFSFAFGKKTFDVYGDATNTLMEADASGGPTTNSLVRSGFVLDAAK